MIQRKTQRPVQFELTEPTRAAVAIWLEKGQLRGDQYLFPSRVASSPPCFDPPYARIVHQWVEAAGLDSSVYGTHSMRRTNATLIYKRTKEPESGSTIAGHTKLESTVRYLGIEVDDAWRSLSKPKSNALYRPHGSITVWPLSGNTLNAYCQPKAVVATSSISNEHRYPRKWQSLREPDHGRGTKGAPPCAFHLSDSFRNPAGKTCRAI